MARLTWLADVLRAAGLPVYEMPGWQDRETRAGFDPRGLVCHHTATSTAWLDGHVAALLRDGRRDLSGPLSQLGLERDGTWVCVAAGRANHNGYGLWGNDSLGVEAYNDGLGEPWPAAQMDSYRRGVAAICAHTGWSVLSQVKGHKETDPGRKVDPTFDMQAFRIQTVNPAPAPVEDDDDMTPEDREWLAAKFQNEREWMATRLEQATGIRLAGAEGAPDGELRSDVWRWTREGAVAARVLLKRDPSVTVTADVDEAAVAQVVLEGLDPAAIASAIPSDLANQVADELASRLAPVPDDAEPS